ncbi:hypothetical protein ACFY4C_17845 [Actinomadura viridis]|uniref:hypothetical protein n=1 Tax=Actinomadura viridis TaxID=58110 RepID=UPI0036BF9A38
MTTQATAVSVVRPPARTPRPGRDRARRGFRHWGLLLLVGWAVQVAVRLWMASGQTVPVATPDEAGYLFAARVLTGGPEADMSYGTVYRGGYALLLLPAFWIADDPVTVYRICLVINALISAAMLPLAYLALRRMGLSRTWSYTLGHVTALLPSVVFYAEFVLTDAILPVLVFGWLLLTHAWLTAAPATPRARVTLYGAAAGAVVAYVYASHTRGVILVIVQVGIMAAAVLFRWRDLRSTGIATAALVLVASAGSVLNGHLLPALYPGGDNNLQGNLVRRLTSVDGYGWVLSLGTGQVWYQIVATGGLAGIGLVTVAAVAVRRGTDPRLRVLTLGVLATIAGIAFATSAALPVEYRIGNYVYGRYLACVTPVLFAVGAAVLLRAALRTVLWAAAATVALAVLAASVVQWYAGDLLSRYTYTRFDFPETSFLTWNWTEFRLWQATLAGLVLLGLALVAARLPRHGPAVLAGLLVVVHLAAVTTATTQISRPLVRGLTAHTDLRGTTDLGAQRSIALDWNVPWTVRLAQFYWAWDSKGTLFDARWTPAPTNVDLVVLAWPKNVPASATWRDAPPGWKVVDSRRTPEGDWVAWRRPPQGDSRHAVTSGRP